jgi:site-specific recombinase XerD
VRRHRTRPTPAPSPTTCSISRKAGPLDGQGFSNRFAGYVHLANIDHRVTLHHPRLFAASIILANGAPIEFVSRQLGSADSRMTSTVYAHVAFTDVAAMHSRFDPLRAVAAS